MITSAAHIGIDSCQIEGFNQELTQALLKKEGAVNTDEFGLAAKIAFGYRTETVEMFSRTKRAIEDIVIWIR